MGRETGNKGFVGEGDVGIGGRGIVGGWKGENLVGLTTGLR